jgi:hypothetical protein
MKTTSWLIVNKNGINAVRKTKPDLNWNEIAVAVHLEIPDELFKRPTVQATLKIEDVPLAEFNPEVIVNTKELIEQQTGAKIEFTVVYEKEERDEK